MLFDIFFNLLRLKHWKRIRYWIETFFFSFKSICSPFCPIEEDVTSRYGIDKFYVQQVWPGNMFGTTHIFNVFFKLHYHIRRACRNEMHVSLKSKNAMCHNVSKAKPGYLFQSYWWNNLQIYFTSGKPSVANQTWLNL